MDRQKIEAGAALILEGLGVDLTDHNFKTTPQRVTKCYQEMFEPKETGWPVFDEDYTDVVIMRKHEFWTLCPHHMLPVKLLASVAYIPNGRVVGASKLIRMVHECNRRPMTQEALTDAIVKSIQHLTSNTSKGEAVKLIGEHGCMRIRGVHTGADMVTYKFAGRFLNEPEMQRRFFDIVHHD